MSDVAFGEIPFCARCKEEFSVDTEPAFWRMGTMRPLSKLPARLRSHLPTNEIHTNGNYLCGNCYFDLTDEE